MVKSRFQTAVILLFSICLVGMLLDVSGAQEETDSDYRSAAWHQTQYGTGPWGNTYVYGQFGPDIGYGEQGTYFQGMNPLTGQYVSYQSTGLGMGLGGPLLGYGGMYSPAAQGSYGPYAFGGTPQVQPTPFYQTQGYLSGNLWGQNTSAYMAQPVSPLAMMAGLLGGYGGYGPYGGYGGGYGGYSPYGGYGGYGGYSPYGGYGGGYGGYGGYSPYGGYGGYSPYGGYGGYSPYGGYGIGGGWW